MTEGPARTKNCDGKWTPPPEIPGSISHLKRELEDRNKRLKELEGVIRWLKALKATAEGEQIAEAEAKRYDLMKRLSDDRVRLNKRLVAAYDVIEAARRVEYDDGYALQEALRNYDEATEKDG